MGNDLNPPSPPVLDASKDLSKQMKKTKQLRTKCIARALKKAKKLLCCFTPKNPQAIVHPHVDNLDPLIKELKNIFSFHTSKTTKKTNMLHAVKTLLTKTKIKTESELDQHQDLDSLFNDLGPDWKDFCKEVKNHQLGKPVLENIANMDTDELGKYCINDQAAAEIATELSSKLTTQHLNNLKDHTKEKTFDVLFLEKAEDERAIYIADNLKSEFQKQHIENLEKSQSALPASNLPPLARGLKNVFSNNTFDTKDTPKMLNAIKDFLTKAGIKTKNELDQHQDLDSLFKDLDPKWTRFYAQVQKHQMGRSIQIFQLMTEIKKSKKIVEHLNKISQQKTITESQMLEGLIALYKYNIENPADRRQTIDDTFHKFTQNCCAKNATVDKLLNQKESDKVAPESEILLAICKISERPFYVQTLRDYSIETNRMREVEQATLQEMEEILKQFGSTA